MIKNFDKKNFVYLWFMFFIIVSIVIFEGVVEYKKSIENASIKTNNLTSLISKKLESDFEYTNNLLNFAQNIILNTIRAACKFHHHKLVNL